MISGWLIVFDFLVMFLSSKDDTPADTPGTRRPFLQMGSIEQHLHISGKKLGRAVQAASASVKNLCHYQFQAGKKSR